MHVDVELKLLKLTYEQDLFPGEYFGEVALEGLHHRGATVQALTDVDLLVIDYESYITARGHNHGHNQMRTQDKEAFLKELPLFKNIDNYTVSRFAHALYYDEIRKGSKVMSQREATPELMFIFSGAVDLYRKLPNNIPMGAAVPQHSVVNMSVMATMQPGDYFCESGLVNARNESTRCRDRVTECCDAVSSTRLGVLKISAEDALSLLPKKTVRQMCDAFTVKTNWRVERKQECKVLEGEKRKKKASHNLDFLFIEPPGDYMPTAEESDAEKRKHASASASSPTHQGGAGDKGEDPVADVPNLGVTPAAARDTGKTTHLVTSAAPLSDLTQARYSLLYMQKHIALPALATAASASVTSYSSVLTSATPGKLTIDTSLPNPGKFGISSSVASLPSRIPPSIEEFGCKATGELPSVRRNKSRKGKRKKGVDVEAAKTNLRGLYAGLHNAKLKPISTTEFGPEVSVESSLPSYSMYAVAPNPFSASNPLGNIPLLDDDVSSVNSAADGDNNGCNDNDSVESLMSPGGTVTVRPIPVGNKSLGVYLKCPQKLSPIPYDGDASESVDNGTIDGTVSQQQQPLPRLKDIPSLINPYDNPMQVLSGCANAKEVGRVIAGFNSKKTSVTGNSTGTGTGKRGHNG